jgi:hypothetical protein
MALQKQSVALPLAKGIDVSVADSLREGDSLSSGKNVEQLISGELTKRNGFGTIIALTNPSFMVPVNDSISITESTGGTEVLNTDDGTLTFSSVETTRKTLSISDLYGSRLSIEAVDTYFNSGIFYTAFQDQTTNGLIRSDSNGNVFWRSSIPYETVPNSPDSMRFAAGFLFTQSGATIRVLDLGTSLSVAASLATNLNLTGNIRRWDVSPYTDFDGTPGYLLVYDDGTNIVIRRYNLSHTIVYSTTTSRTNVETVCIFPVYVSQFFISGFCVGLARTAGNYLSLLRYDDTATLQGTANSSTATVSYNNMTGCFQYVAGSSSIFFASESGSSVDSNSVLIYKLAYNFTGTINLASFLTTTLPYSGLASKWFQLTNTDLPKIIISHKSVDTYNLQNCYFLIEYTNNGARYLSKFSYGYAPNYFSNYNVSYNSSSWILPNVSINGAGDFLTAIKTRIDSSDLQTAANGVYNLRRLSIKNDTYFTGKATNDSSLSFVASNGAYANDGGKLTYMNFALYPDPITSVTRTGAGAIADGTYSYVLVYEFYDNKGNLLESSPSVPYTAVYNAGLGASTYTVASVATSVLRQSGVQVALYRTTASGTIYYRLNSQAGTVGTVVSFSDSAADSQITSSKLLYTTGNIAENIDPPNCNFIGVGKNRLWTFETGVSDILWFSKKFREGYIPVFSDLLTLNMGKSYGALVGVAQIDDKMLIFKEYGIYVLFGDGPSDNLIGEFSEPTVVVQGMGCIEARSILETTQGVIYQSQEGLYLIDKSLQNQFVGRPLYKSEGTIRAAVYDAAKNCCYFLTTTKLWVFYMTNPSWFEWTVSNPVDLVMSNGSLYLATTTKLLKQSAGVYQDDSSNYEQTIKLGQFQFAGIQGYQRLYRLLVTGRKTTDADATNITAKVYINGNTSVTDTKTIPHTTALSGNRFEIEIRPSIQKCETMELEITQTAATSGMRLSAVTAEVGGLIGSGKRGSDRRL